ncbi:hypothetical protein LX36DRAFT_462509 [Colletotrichum falcatum]|nr:hypothetical protein LX36DRAFT_462509 [Colletotrichum falcatum]
MAMVMGWRFRVRVLARTMQAFKKKTSFAVVLQDAPDGGMSLLCLFTEFAPRPRALSCLSCVFAGLCASQVLVALANQKPGRASLQSVVVYLVFLFLLLSSVIRDRGGTTVFFKCGSGGSDVAREPCMDGVRFAAAGAVTDRESESESERERGLRRIGIAGAGWFRQRSIDGKGGYKAEQQTNAQTETRRWTKKRWCCCCCSNCASPGEN